MSSAPVPLRCVPTLTEVIEPVSLSLASALAAAPDVPQADPWIAAPESSSALSDDAQELIVQRVLLRIDGLLEQRLRNAVERIILEHSQVLAPRLHEEVALAVRESVAQAFAQEAVCVAVQP
jgi:hypothetical protein